MLFLSLLLAIGFFLLHCNFFDFIELSFYNSTLVLNNSRHKVAKKR